MHEQEEGEVDKEQQKLIDELVTLAGAGTTAETGASYAAKNGVSFKVYQQNGGTEAKPQPIPGTVLVVPEGEEGAQAGKIIDSNQKNEKMTRVGISYWGQIFGGEEAEEPTDDTADDDAVDDETPGAPIEEPIDPQEEQANGEAQALEDSFKPGGDLGFPEDGGPSRLFPGYSPTTRGLWDRAVAGIRATVQRIVNPDYDPDEKEDVGGRSLVGNLAQKSARSTQITADKKREALQVVAVATRIIKTIHEGKPPDPADLRKVAENAQVTKNGILWGEGVNSMYFQYRSKSNIETDIYRNMVEQINEAIDTHNELVANDPQRSIPKVAVPVKMGTLTARRGLLLEFTTVMNDLSLQYRKECQPGIQTPRCTELANKISEQWEQAKKQGTPEEIRGMFAMAAEGNEYVDGLLLRYEDKQDVEIVEKIVDFLVYERGLSPEQAWAVVAMAGQDADPNKAMLILLHSTQGYNRWTEDLDIRESWVAGLAGQLKGQKADIIRRVTQASFDKLIAKLIAERDANPLEKALAQKAQCANGTAKGSSGQTVEEMGGGVGIDHLGSASDGNVEFGTEQKALSSSDGRTKMGEGKNNRLTQLCQDNRPANTPNQIANNAEEDRFMEINDLRIENCLNSPGAAAFKKSLGTNEDGTDKTMRQAACEFQDAINSEMADYDAAFRGENIGVPPDTDAAPAGGHEYIDHWSGDCEGDQAGGKKCQRAILAKEAVTAKANGQPVSSEQASALKKVRGEIEQTKIHERLSSSDHSHEGTAYLAYRLTLEGGSTKETVKDIRSYGDADQRVGLIGDSIYGSIGMLLAGEASFEQGGNTHRLKVNDGVVPGVDSASLLSLSFERGQAVASVEDGVMSNHSDPEFVGPSRFGFDPTPGEQEKPRAAAGVGGENLLLSFLKGQQQLLEKLIEPHGIPTLK